MPVSSRKFKNISVRSKRLLWNTSNITAGCGNLKNLWLHMWPNFTDCHDIASSENPWKTCSVIDWYVESATTASSTIFLPKLTSVSKKAFELAQAMKSADRNTQDLQKATGQSATVYVVRKQGSSGSATDAGADTGQATVDSKVQNAEPAGACCESLQEHVARVCRSRTQEAKPVPAGQGKSAHSGQVHI